MGRLTPEGRIIKKKVVVLLATGLGLGYSPVASGTVGSLLGIPIAAAMVSLGLGWQVAVVVLLALVAMPICDYAEDHFARKDDGRIVADEYLTFPICLIGLPWIEHLWLLPVAFVVCRVFDIIKPPPAHGIQKLRGGKAVVLDDVFSSLYALLANHIIFRMVAGRL